MFRLVLSCGHFNFRILHFKISCSSEAGKHYSPCRNTVYPWRNTRFTTSFVLSLRSSRSLQIFFFFLPQTKSALYANSCISHFVSPDCAPNKPNKYIDLRCVLDSWPVFYFVSAPPPLPKKSEEGNTVNWVAAQLLHTTVMFYYGKSLSVFALFFFFFLFSNFHVQMFIHALANFLIFFAALTTMRGIKTTNRHEEMKVLIWIEINL